MALSVAEFTIKRKLNELRVSDIKNQLALRGLERTGVKATLIDRLKKALEEEGKDPEEYLFEIDLKKEFDSKDMEKEEEELANDVNQIENDADNGDLEMNTGQDINVVKEQSDVPGIMSSTPKKSGTESNQSENGAPEGLSLGDELVFSDENKTTTESADQAAESGTTRSSQDSVNTTDPHQDVDTGTSRQTENQVAHKEEDKPDLEASTTSTTTMDKEQQEQQQGSPSTAAKELPLGGKMSEPPSPDSVPVVVPFTKEDLIHMDTSAERQVDEDISLIVHIDESQMDLDNDLLNTPAKQSSTSAARASTDEAKPDAENSHSSTNGQSVSKTSRDDGSKCPEDKTDGRTDTSTASESRMKENEDKSVTSQTKDGDKAKSSEKSDVKDDKAKTIASSSRSLWISGLSSSTRATDLKTLFSKYGKVAGAKVVTNAKSPGSRCYGFVTMTTADEASKCIQHLHRTELHGKMISVERAKGDPSAQAKTASKSSSATSQKKEDRTSGSDRRDSGHERRRSRHQSSGHSREGDHHSRRSSRHRSPGSVSSSRATRERDTKDRQSKDRKSSRDKDGKSKEKDILDFEKIKAERERERLKQRERQMREEERRRMRELERMRERQHDIERRQKEEAIRLEREKQKLRLEQQRLERERLEAERERIALERERQRRERENLEREREQERLHQLRLEQERRVLKRNYDSRAGGRDEYWTDPKRLNLDRGMRYEERPGADGFVRRIERYDRRDIVPPPRPADRFEGRRDDKHDVRRPPGPHRDNKDRDDRGRAAEDRNRNIRYTDRRDGPPGRDHDRPRHDRDRSPHGPPHPNGPAHHGPPRSSPLHRQPDSRADWKSERAPPAREGRGRGNRPGGMAHDWSAGDRSTTASAPNVSSQPGDRAWSGPGGPQPAAITVQQPLLQTPPTSAAFLASAANIMMGVRMAGGRNSTQDARYDAYKTIQGGNVGRY